MALQRKDASQLDGDQPGRRKPFVIVASVLMAVSMAIPLISPTLIALFIQTVLARSPSASTGTSTRRSSSMCCLMRTPPAATWA
jgi:hypothetical protein